MFEKIWYLYLSKENGSVKMQGNWEKNWRNAVCKNISTFIHIIHYNNDNIQYFELKKWK